MVANSAHKGKGVLLLILKLLKNMQVRYDFTPNSRSYTFMPKWWHNSFCFQMASLFFPQSNQNKRSFITPQNHRADASLVIPYVASFPHLIDPPWRTTRLDNPPVGIRDMMWKSLPVHLAVRLIRSSCTKIVLTPTQSQHLQSAQYLISRRHR